MRIHVNLVPTDMKNLFTLMLTLLTGLSFAQSPFGLFDSHTDIGQVRTPGFAHYQAEDQTYTIGGGGKNMWFGEDEFHYLWTTVQGDFILRAEVNLLGAGVDPHRKAGWIVKNDLKANTPHVNAAVHGDGLTALQYRRKTGNETNEIVSTDSFPDVIQLERRGDLFLMSTARFGEEFTTVQLDSLPLDQEVYVGLYVCAHNPNVLETARFRNVRIIRPAGPELVPYQDYLGSNLEIMDIETGHRQVLYYSAHSIQAPNWTVDGKKLIYNSKGLLYNYELATGEISILNTGFANRNNNDHVLTFDGKTMGISHHNPDDNGNSTLYYLPVEGSDRPTLVTPPGRGASYFHGWSPDGKKMLFTGQRKGQYDIYAIDIDSQVETQLTDKSTLDDGPEYSPDGQYIFFNSARTGTMQLWRMAPDGSDQTQLTFDEYNDWFPHVSPDQKWIVFLSYPPEVDAGDHPFYKRCLLRIMPYEGGTPRVIGYIYGGQGTINVPSWSPDGKKIAFVTNSN